MSPVALTARFDGSQLTSDGGLVWLAEVDAALGSRARLAGAIPEPYVKLYLRGKPGPDTGGKTPDHMELSLNAESGTVVIPIPGETSTERLRVTPVSQTNVAPVTTKDDCS